MSKFEDPGHNCHRLAPRRRFAELTVAAAVVFWSPLSHYPEPRATSCCGAADLLAAIDRYNMYNKMEWSERGNDKLGALETKWSREIAWPFDYQSENLSENIKHPHVVFSYSTKIFPQFVVCMSVAHYL